MLFGLVPGFTKAFYGAFAQAVRQNTLLSTLLPEEVAKNSGFAQAQRKKEIDVIEAAASAFLRAGLIKERKPSTHDSPTHVLPIAATCVRLVVDKWCGMLRLPVFVQ